MIRKLLEKTLRIYVIYSIIVLALTGPGFYFLIRYWDQQEAKETLYDRFDKFKKNNLAEFEVADIDKWNKYNNQIQLLLNVNSILPKDLTISDSINLTNNETEPTWVLKAPVKIKGRDYIFVTEVNQLESDDLIFNIVLLYLIILVFLLSGMYLLTKKYSTTLWKPFFHLLEQLETYDIDKTIKVRFNPTSTEEFHRMNLVIQNLLERNLEIFNNQKEFIENASHELQTPLAIVQAKIENLIQKSNLSAAEAEAIATVENSISRLTKLNRNLLLLSRIEQGNFPDAENIGINDLLHSPLERLKDLAFDSSVLIESELLSNFQLFCNLYLAECMINNLLVNAIQHNAPGGVVKVITMENKLKIENTSLGSALDPLKIFNRFSKKDSSTTGNGLGLAISDRIARFYNWKISYEHSQKKHIFTIKFQ